jgi:hypothetical protein
LAVSASFRWIQNNEAASAKAMSVEIRTMTMSHLGIFKLSPLN